MSVARLKEMFERMVVAKDASLVPVFYHPEFELTTNGQTQAFEEFAAGHRRVYATEITYRVEYDEQAWVEAGDRLAGRVWITTRRPGEAATRIEVVLIAAWADGTLHRLWELTWPDWSQLDAFDAYP